MSSNSFTDSESATFTITHARHLAAKIATDLKRIQRFYDRPSDTTIANYEAEATELLRAGYLGIVTYGFKRDGVWIEPTLTYTAKDLAGAVAADDDPGRIRPGANIDGAIFYSFMSYSPAWDNITDEEKAEFKKGLPVERGGADYPGISGYFSEDRVYSAGGRALNRTSLRSTQ